MDGLESQQNVDINGHMQRQLLDQSSKSKSKKNSMCYNTNFIRYMLQTFNVLFFFSGCIISIAAIWSIFWKHQYVSLLSPTYALSSYGLLLSGVFTIATALFGSYVVWRDQRSMICCYSLLLMLVFALELVVGVLAYGYESQVDDELLMTLNETFVTSYGVDETRTNSIDLMQQTFKCCGAVRFEEWNSSIWLKTSQNSSDFGPYIRSNLNRVVPDSCCISYREMCGKSDHPSNIPYTGCIYQLIDETRDHLRILEAIGFGFCFVQFFGLILSCCLYLK